MQWRFFLEGDTFTSNSIMNNGTERVYTFDHLAIIQKSIERPVWILLVMSWFLDASGRVTGLLLLHHVLRSCASS